MNILIDARPLCIPHPGGITRVTKQLLDELFVADTTNNYLLGTTGMHRPMLGWDDRRHTHLHRRIPNKVVSALASTRLFSFEQWMRSTPFDLLFLPNIGFVGAPRLPYVLLVHDLTFLTEPRWYSLHGRLWHQAVHAIDLIRGAKQIVTISQFVKDDLKRQLSIKDEHITVLPFRPTPMGILKTLPPDLEGKRYLLCLGRGDRRKNSSAILQAWNLIKTESAFRDIELVFIGSDDQKIQIPGVHHFRRPSDDGLATLYKHAAVFCYPSWSEGYGLPLQEAARFGTPCIASYGSALEETAPTGTLFIPPEKPHLLLEALRIQLVVPQKTSLKTSSIPNESGRALLRIFEDIKKA